MVIAILGYGKMGKEIEQISLERNHRIGLKVNSLNQEKLTIKNLKECDVAIEFSRPEEAIKNINLCANAGCPVVVGTTGWYDNYKRVTELIIERKTALLASTNFSIGVNLFFELNNTLARLMEKQIDYKAKITEIHHLEKLDSPSGTAISLAEGIIENNTTYENWLNEKSSQGNVLEIISERKDKVPGTHIINYSSEIDEIEIKHTAKNRKGFALGAIVAAEFIKDKKGVFTMKDVLKK